MVLKKIVSVPLLLCAMILVSCRNEKNEKTAAIEKSQDELFALLEQDGLKPVSRYAIVNQIAANHVSLNDQRALGLRLLARAHAIGYTYMIHAIIQLKHTAAVAICLRAGLLFGRHPRKCIELILLVKHNRCPLIGYY